MIFGSPDLYLQFRLKRLDDYFCNSNGVFALSKAWNLCLQSYQSNQTHICNFSQDYHFLLQNPQTPEGFLKGLCRLSEGVSEGISEGFLKGPRTCQLKDPSKRLQEPFKNPSETPSETPSENLLRSGRSVAGNAGLENLAIPLR